MLTSQASRCVVIAAIFWAVPANADTTIAGRASVIDGDTLEIRGERIRLHGIDAPEAGQRCTDTSGAVWRCGQRSALALSDKIGAAVVECHTSQRDRYGRHIAVCLANGEDLGAWLVREGLALAYRRYSGDYMDEEAAAERTGAGMWGGSFVAPWEYRRGKR